MNPQITNFYFEFFFFLHFSTFLTGSFSTFHSRFPAISKILNDEKASSEERFAPRPHPDFVSKKNIWPTIESPARICA